MWPFRKKPESIKKPVEKVYYALVPAEDVTALECANIMADILGSLRSLRVTDTYVESLPEPMRRHFKPALVERQTPSADAPSSIP